MRSVPSSRPLIPISAPFTFAKHTVPTVVNLDRTSGCCAESCVFCPVLSNSYLGLAIVLYQPKSGVTYSQQTPDSHSDFTPFTPCTGLPQCPSLLSHRISMLIREDVLCVDWAVLRPDASRSPGIMRRCSRLNANSFTSEWYIHDICRQLRMLRPQVQEMASKSRLRSHQQQVGCCRYETYLASAV